MGQFQFKMDVSEEFKEALRSITSRQPAIPLPVFITKPDRDGITNAIALMNGHFVHIGIYEHVNGENVLILNTKGENLFHDQL